METNFTKTLKVAGYSIENAIKNEGKPFYLGYYEFGLAKGWVVTADTPENFWGFPQRFCVPTKVSGLFHLRAKWQQRKMANSIGLPVKKVVFAAVADEESIFNFGPIPIEYLEMDIEDLNQKVAKHTKEGKPDLADAARRAILLRTEYAVNDNPFFGARAARIALSDL